MNASTRMGRTDWLELGLRQLAHQGAEGVRLEVVCAAAGKTRGSFYHHFEDMETYWQALIVHWRATRVTAMLAEASVEDVAAMSPEEMVGFVATLDYRLELGLRELARRADALSAELAEADAERLRFSAFVLRARYGLDATAAIEVATLDYAAFSGTVLLNPDISEEAQMRLCARFYAMLDAYYGRSG